VEVPEKKKEGRLKQKGLERHIPLKDWGDLMQKFRADLRGGYNAGKKGGRQKSTTTGQEHE